MDGDIRQVRVGSNLFRQNIKLSPYHPTQDATRPSCLGHTQGINQGAQNAIIAFSFRKL